LADGVKFFFCSFFFLLSSFFILHSSFFISLLSLHHGSNITARSSQCLSSSLGQIASQLKKENYYHLQKKKNQTNKPL